MVISVNSSKYFLLCFWSPPTEGFLYYLLNALLCSDVTKCYLCLTHSLQWAFTAFLLKTASWWEQWGWNMTFLTHSRKETKVCTYSHTVETPLPRKTEVLISNPAWVHTVCGCLWVYQSGNETRSRWGHCYCAFQYINWSASASYH